MSDQQRAEALERANTSRLAGADLLRRILAAPDRVLAVEMVVNTLRWPPEDAGAVSVPQLLRCIPGVAAVKVDQICEAADVFGSPWLRDLSSSQRGGLAAGVLVVTGVRF